MVSKKLRKGLILTNTVTLSRGVVIDWGLGRMKYRNYLPIPSYDRKADAVRVSTGSGIEVWPIKAVTLG